MQEKLKVKRRMTNEVNNYYYRIFLFFSSLRLCAAFTMDVIASTAFGVKIDSHNDPNNQFVTMGRKAFNFSLASPAVILICK